MLSTSKLTGGIDREVRTLITNLDNCAARFIAVYPDAEVTVCKHQTGSFCKLVTLM